MNGFLSPTHVCSPLCWLHSHAGSLREVKSDWWPQHTPTVYQPAWNRCFSPRPSWAQTGQCAYSGTHPRCQGHGTDWWVVPPHVSTHRARWPLSLWRGKGQPWKLGRWSSYGPCSLVLSICGCRPLDLLPLDSFSFRAQVKFYLLREEGTDYLSERKFYLYFLNMPSCLFPSEPVFCSSSLPPPPHLPFPTLSSAPSSFP